MARIINCRFWPDREDGEKLGRGSPSRTMLWEGDLFLCSDHA
jgi:hypothetical protein